MSFMKMHSGEEPHEKASGKHDFVAQIIAFAAFIILPLSSFAPLWLAPLLVIVGVVAVGNLLITRRFYTLPWPKIKKISALFVIFWIWCACSLLWTIGYKETGIEVIRLGLFMAILPLFAWSCTASLSSKQLIGRYLVYGCCLGAVLLLLQILIDRTFLSIIFDQKFFITPLQQLNRVAAVLAVIMWPTIGWIWRRKHRGLAVMFWLTCLLILWKLENETAFFAAIAASTAALLVVIKPYVSVNIFSFLIFLAVIMAPILPQTILSPERWLGFSCNYTAPSALHRLYVWQFAVGKTLEKPVIGWGLNTARIMPGGRDVIDIKPPCKNNWTSGESLPLHTHNAILQIWLELGGIGAVIFAFILAVINLGILNPSRALAAFSQGQVASAILISGLGFGAWQSWWLSLLWLSALIMVSIRSENIID